MVERRSPKPDVEGSSPSGRDLSNKRNKMANQTNEKMAKSQDFKAAATAYFKSVKLEWGKITWPGKQQVIVETIYVVVITAVFTIGVLVLDTIFDLIFKALHLK